MLTLFILIALFTLPAYSPVKKAMYIPESKALEPYEVIWQATCKVESNFKVDAIGDLHLKDKSYGISQIRKTRLDDYYRQTGIRYSEKDMFDPVKSKKVFLFYAHQFHPSQIEEISRCWNGGERAMSKKSTIKYWKKVQANLKSEL